MSRSGATCPLLFDNHDLGRPAASKVSRRRSGPVMIAVVVDGENGKEYRIPTKTEIELAVRDRTEIERCLRGIALRTTHRGYPGAYSVPAATGLLCVDMACSRWADLFTTQTALSP